MAMQSQGDLLLTDESTGQSLQRSGHMAFKTIDQQ